MALEDAVSSHHHRYQTFLAHHESETDLLSSALVEAEERGRMQLEEIFSRHFAQLTTTQSGHAQQLETLQVSREDRMSQHLRVMSVLEADSANEENVQQDFKKRMDVVMLAMARIREGRDSDIESVRHDYAPRIAVLEAQLQDNPLEAVVTDLRTRLADISGRQAPLQARVEECAMNSADAEKRYLGQLAQHDAEMAQLAEDIGAEDDASQLRLSAAANAEESGRASALTSFKQKVEDKRRMVHALQQDVATLLNEIQEAKDAAVAAAEAAAANKAAEAATLVQAGLRGTMDRRRTTVLRNEQLRLKRERSAVARVVVANALQARTRGRAARLRAETLRSAAAQLVVANALQARTRGHTARLRSTKLRQELQLKLEAERIAEEERQAEKLRAAAAAAAAAAKREAELKAAAAATADAQKALGAAKREAAEAMKGVYEARP